MNDLRSHRPLAFLAALVLVVAGCARPSGTRVRDLERVEIRQYHGKKLSSVNDFIENSIKGPQYVKKSTYRLKIGGLVDRPLTLTYDQTIGGRQRFRKVVRLDCVEGWSVTVLWEGFLVRSLLDQAGVKKQAKVVILRAADGYSTSFPVDYFYKKDIIIADKMNGVVIPAERGFPFMLVAEDKWGWKWIKWITSIELSDEASFRGYWERRGYTNKGDRNKFYLGR